MQFAYIWISMSLMQALASPTAMLLKRNPRVQALRERLEKFITRGSCNWDTTLNLYYVLSIKLVIEGGTNSVLMLLQWRQNKPTMRVMAMTYTKVCWSPHAACKISSLRRQAECSLSYPSGHLPLCYWCLHHLCRGYNCVLWLGLPTIQSRDSSVRFLQSEYSFKLQSTCSPTWGSPWIWLYRSSCLSIWSFCNSKLAHQLSDMMYRSSMSGRLVSLLRMFSSRYAHCCGYTDGGNTNHSHKWLNLTLLRHQKL